MLALLNTSVLIGCSTHCLLHYNVQFLKQQNLCIIVTDGLRKSVLNTEVTVLSKVTSYSFTMGNYWN